MKKITIILFAIFSIAINGNSQGVIKTTQKLIELEKGKKGETVIGSVLAGDFIYTISQIGKGRRSTTTISKFDTRMKLIKKTDWDLNFREGRINRILVLNNKIFVLFEMIDTKIKIAEVFSRALDKNSLKLSSKEILISKKFTKKRYTPDYSIIEENEKVLIYQSSENNRKKNLSLSMKVLGDNLKEIWEKEINFPFSNKNSNFDDIEINENGDVYFVVDIKEKDSKIRKKHLYACTDKGNKLINNELSSLPEFVTDIKLASSNHNQLIVAGYYNQKVERAWKKGSYFLKLNTDDLSVTSSTKGLFPVTLLMKKKSNKVKRKAIRKEIKGKDSGLDNHFSVDEIITKEDGGAIIIGEHYHVYTTSYTTTDANGRSTTRYTTNYEYDDILIISISKNGEIEWERIIPKMQHISGSSAGCGYFRMVVEDKIFFIFNDDRENHKPNNEETVNFLANKKNRIISIYEINSIGNIRKDILTDYLKIESMILPSSSDQIGEKEVLFYLWGKKRTKKILMIKFD